MSRADASERITRAAVTLGVTEGVGALSLQAIARMAGVSKSLLLYHFAGKPLLLGAVVRMLGSESEARLRQAATAPDALDAWRLLVRDEAARGELALLGALALETEVDLQMLRAVGAAREGAATLLASAVLTGVHLVPRVPAALLGRLLLRHLDGVVSARTHERTALPAELDAELDAFALALLALGH